MKKHIITSLLMVLALTGIISFNSCSSSDDGPIIETKFLTNVYSGNAIGNSQHFQNMPSTTTDSVIVTPVDEEYLKFNIEFRSGFWGNAIFQNVTVRPIDQGVYQFDATEGTILMPNRGQGAANDGEVSFKEYPAKLTNSTVILAGTKFSFTVEADLGERAGIYAITLSNIEAAKD